MTPADTRAETLIAWLHRLEHAHATTIAYPVTKSLTIHILGADHREGNSGPATFEVFRTFTEHMAARTYLTLLKLVLVGPNVSRTLHLEEFTQQCLVPVSDNGEATTCDVRIRYFVGSFETYFQDKAQVWQPDLVVCFNAGIWGYNEWLPAIQLVLKDVQRPLLVTSYNADEAGDDEDVLDELKLGEWLWRPEKNPWGAKTPRATNNVDAKMLKENDYWMCLTGSWQA